MLALHFGSLRAFATVALFSALLGGCTINGTYPDAAEPDAAKLRFISNTQNATLDYFDAAHCDGQTTGPLNNLFTSQSQRRVGMSVAPPADAKGYLEIKLKPDQDTFLRTQTLGGYSVCGTGFNLTPQRGAEYEVTLSAGGGYCKTTLHRVQRVDGKDVRTPMLLDRNGVAACVGRNAIFPKLPDALPDTPRRVTLINQIIDSSVIASMKPDPAKATRSTPEHLDQLIAERKAKLGFTLPDDYWALYRQNLIAFEDEMAGKKGETLKRYTAEYRVRLQRLDDQQLEQWALPEDKWAKPANAAAFAEYKAMAIYYFQISNRLTIETVGNHLERMAKMDEQYGVCARFSDCWKRA
ncbi:hypothetical protein [Pseudomonas sp. PD9R]|uniref:hypothetical protein n=1 Tax=Pseudomonas sp. PD9R TaxID=2853534 RepID=UPI001C4472CC|nr:hypothetical protein [Pseudomonas sp. PD9R]MBV6821796.1 hypothetical protein [Pseudomonas sp. PD9R]